MAVSDQQIRDYVIANADNPAAIAQAAAQAGVSPAQVASALGVSPTVAQGIISGELQPLVGYSGGIQTGEGEFVGAETPYIAAVATNPDKAGGVYNVFEPTGEYRLTQQVNTNNQLGEIAKFFAPAILGSFAPSISSALGSATGLTGANLAALTGATIGGGTAALTGNNALQGALLGGLGGYITAGGFGSDAGSNAASAAADADIAGGMVPEYGTNAAYDAFMANAMTPEALAALEKQIAESSVGGLSYQDILNQGGLITDMASGNFMGPLTADELGNAFEKYMADAGYFPVGTVTPPGGVVPPADTPVTPPDGTKVLDTASKVVDPDLAKVIASGVTKVLPGLLTAGALSQMTNKPSVGALPTQGVPTNSPEYYQAIQQYYNTYMPEQPRDVATPLQQWYDSKYGA